MPIIAFFGVPDWKTSEENFRTFSECGFTVSEYPTYESMDLLVKACRIADKYGVRLIGRCQEMASDPVKAANTLKKEPGFFGYFIQDEPSEPDIHQREKEMQRIKRADSTHVFYMNLHPYYHDSWVQPTLKVKAYPEYLRSPLISIPSPRLASDPHGIIIWRWCDGRVSAQASLSGALSCRCRTMCPSRLAPTTPLPP